MCIISSRERRAVIALITSSPCVRPVTTFSIARTRRARLSARPEDFGWVRRNNRQLHKATIRKGGKRQRNTAPKEVHGFRLFDCVSYQGTMCFVFGRRSTGYFDVRLLDGTKIHASASVKKLRV